MGRENIEKLQEEFKKQIKELDKKLKEQEEEKKDIPKYKNYYIKRDLPRKENKNT